ncbi:hypothetical protein [Vitiosangium sp. GDMCC 1.1324]|uniref:hypothetical protein n=1 Tax=Vitiosangium sp. (strain GDMCC 1.1324) TaxID=2138576 RepID=UPI000D332B46|nr:hypothetical protein [Vitiosangium sp. GDMCC 1.1324]PTL79517.1 hypothetical protein DAT35_32390 [Vitiosangium sp. GDMCC 1.1324]
MGVRAPRLHLEIGTLVLPEGLVPHPEAFREALAAQLTRLFTERGLEGMGFGPESTLRLESATLSLPAGLGTEAAAAHVAEQLLSQLTGGPELK